jgi:hypothetical protein
MNARYLSVSLSLAALVLAASADAVAQGRGGGGGGMGNAGMGAGASRGMPGAGGMPSGMQRGIEPAPSSVDRPSDLRNSNSQHQGAAAPQSHEQRSAQDLLQQNSKLSENLSKLLPAGTDVQAAASGFSNLGEFVAAVHVSNNLGIPFADLKTKMLAGDSLGSAIQALKPEADGQIEARRARARADELTRG